MTPPQEDRISVLDIYRTEDLVFPEELIEAGKIKPSQNHNEDYNKSANK